MKFFSAALAVACALLYANVLNSCAPMEASQPTPAQVRIYTFLHTGW